ncbi:hypothetical protein F5146DRAFT_1006039 [Armillaria mellea]|nr:hypothetical protein F5146DRAFT_1006039 [Armillaria mellea]
MTTLVQKKTMPGKLCSSRKKQFTTVNIKNTYPGEEHSPTGFTSFFKENKHLLPYPRTVDFQLSGLQEEENISKLLSKITTLTTLTAIVINDVEIWAVQNCIDSNARSLSDLKISSINPIQVNLICLESHSHKLHLFDLRNCIQLRKIDITVEGRTGLKACITMLETVVSVLESVSLELHLPYYKQKGSDQDYMQLFNLLNVQMSRRLVRHHISVKLALVHDYIWPSEKQELH